MPKPPTTVVGLLACGLFVCSCEAASDAPADSVHSEVSSDADTADAYLALCAPVTVTVLAVDGSAINSGVPHEPTVEILPRIVGDELHFQADIKFIEPQAVGADFVTLAFRAPLPETGKDVVDGWDSVKLIRFEHTGYRKGGYTAVALGPLVPAGCVTLRRTGGGYAADVRVEAMLVSHGPSPLPPGHLVSLAARFVWTDADMKALTRYQGECPPQGSAVYLPAMMKSPGPSLPEWVSKVEPDCATAIGCFKPPNPECGEGDAWTCATCFGTTCLQPALQSECSAR
jgi:hypothetical protein